MKTKILSILFAVVFMVSVLSFNSFAAEAPNNEETEKIFYDMGFSAIMSGKDYFGCDVLSPQGSNASDAMVFEYMMNSGALADYVQHQDGYSTYTVPYDDYIEMVDRAFVNHTDMKNYLRDYEWVDFNEESGTITWNYGGSGGPFTWVVLYTTYADDLVYATGVYADFAFDADGLVENEDYIIIDGSKAKIKEELLLTLKYTDGEWKILEYRPCHYHVINGVLYDSLSAEGSDKYYSLRIDSANAAVAEHENSNLSATHFYGNDISWYLPGQELEYTVTAADGYVASYAMLSDDNGERFVDISGSGICTVSPNGPAVLKIVTRTQGKTAVEEFINKILDFFTTLPLRFASIFNFI